MAHDIFISHSSNDRDIANKLCYVLEENNFKCWIAPRDLGSGNIREEIFNAVDDSKIVLLVFSNDSQHSSYVLDEIDFAFTHRKTIISFNIDNSFPEGNMDFYLKNTTWVAAYPEPVDSFQQLINVASNFVNLASSNRGLDSNTVRTSLSEYGSPRQREAYFFIGYEDGLIENEIEQFKAWGYDFKSGELSGDEFKGYVEECELFVVFITDNAADSSNIKDAIDFAFSKNKEVVPIYLVKSKLKFSFKFKLKYRSKLKNFDSKAIFKYKLAPEEYGEKFGSVLKEFGFEKSSADNFDKVRHVIEDDDKLHFSSKNHSNFKYLENLINNSSQIDLDTDIVLDDNEIDLYEKGIEINKEKLIINGNDHTIDAKLKTRIFNIKNGNVCFNDVNFINGKSKDYGGAICAAESSDLIFNNCSFQNNSSLYGGSLYIKGGKSTIIKTEFNKNKAESRGGALQLEEGVVEIIECEFNQNSSRFGGAIRSDKTDLKVSDSTLEGNFARSGAAVNYNAGELDFINCKFLKNTAENQGGAFETRDGILKVLNCKFNGNSALRGAILDSYTQSTLKDCIICHNTADEGCVVFNEIGNCNILNCEISNNDSPNDIIVNKDSFNVHDSNFLSNSAENIIINDKASNFSLYGGKFCNNSAGKYLIFNVGKSFNMTRSTFTDNESELICNESELTISALNFNSHDKLILNNGEVFIKADGEELKKIIDNHGSVELMLRKESKYDFTYLDGLIHSTDCDEVKLTHDISFENYEIDFYEGGIDLDMDDLTIDGDGNVIDGASKSRIFIISGKNITLKNIIFKNGYSHQNNYLNPFNNNGGAIRNNSKSNLCIENCTFIDNSSEDSGGAIDNRGGNIKILKSCFKDNNAVYNGGAIKNQKNARIEIAETLFDTNSSKREGGAIDNEGRIELFESNLKHNLAKYGGAIQNNGDEIIITSSEFENNKADNGGAIHNREDARIEIKNSELKNNIAQYGGAIENRGYELILQKDALNENKAEKDGGALYNFHSNNIEINNCTLTKNTADRNGGAIWNFSRNKLKIVDSTIVENYPDNIYENRN